MTDQDAVLLPVTLPIPFRKILLRVLLWSLGIAAACGAIAVLSGGWHTVSRVMGTAMLTAGASLLLLGSAYLVDRPLTRAAGLLGMTAVVVEYLLSLALIWRSDDLDIVLTIAFIATPVIPAMIFLTMARVAEARIAGRVGVACCLLVGMLLLGGVWLDEYPWDDNTWYALAGAVGTFFPVAVMCLVGAGTDRRHWRWIGVVASALACGRFFYELESSPRSGETLFAAVVSLGLMIAHANVLMLLPLNSRQRWLRWTTILATIATAIFIDLVVLGQELGHAREWFGIYERWAGACAIIAGCGTLALLVLGRLNRRVEQPVHKLETITEVTLICPVCRKKQTLPVGDANCISCNIVIHTHFEPPRCRACGYSLFMLGSDRCPECGTPVHQGSEVAANGVAHLQSQPVPASHLRG